MSGNTFSMGTSFNASSTPAPAAPGASASDAGPVIKDSDTANFMKDVIETSRSTPVIVDFWAPWCGPCKQLGPALEKVVQEAGGKVRMVKINVDLGFRIVEEALSMRKDL